jgi:hypothetical protein
MLVVSNGAFKSGSTWLFMILRSMTGFSPPPTEYWDPNWDDDIVYSIDPKKIASFLENVDFSSSSYLSKNHLGLRKHRRLLLARDQVFVLDIDRDIRDVVVSAYYHDRKLQGYNQSFETYYWGRGRYVARKVLKHHATWQPSSPRVYVSSFESLKADTHSEIARIGQFLGFDLSAPEIDRIAEETAFGRLRAATSEWNEKSGRFRKGIVGDWQNHFEQPMLDDIDRIEAQMSSAVGRAVADLTSVPRRAYRKGKRLVLGR